MAAGVRLHEAVAGRLKDITAIRAPVKHDTLACAADPDKFHPQDRETAGHSLPSCVAMALLNGAVTEAQFNNARYADPDVMRLTGLVESLADPEFDRLFPKGAPAPSTCCFAMAAR